MMVVRTALLVLGLVGVLPPELSAASGSRTVAIRGTVVAEDARCSVLGTLVYVPGGVMVKLGADGRFTIPRVPRTAETLRIEVPGRPAQDVGLTLSEDVTDLGLLSVAVACDECGDRLTAEGEACDDGNTASSDGCSSACQVEAGFVCTGQPSVCGLSSACGDGVIAGPGEACDDGGIASGDGCSATCQVEAGFQCQGQPSECTPITVNVVNIQNGSIPTNSVVQLVDVVVTAIGSDGRTLWVADALTAAPFNGIQVFRGTLAPSLPPEIVVGAVVNVSGTVQEFNSGGGAGTLTQIGQTPAITFVSGPLGFPVPAGVPVATLVNDLTGEPYEGVLVVISNVTVTSPANGSGVRNMAAGPVVFVSDDDIVQISEPASTCYSTLVGIWSYQVFLDQWAILPVPGGASIGGSCD